MTVRWTQLIEEHSGEPITDWILRRRRPGEAGGRLIPAMTWAEIADEIARITNGAVNLTDEALRKRFVDADRQQKAAS